MFIYIYVYIYIYILAGSLHFKFEVFVGAEVSQINCIRAQAQN